MSRRLAFSATIAVLGASPVIAQDRGSHDAGDRLSQSINAALEAEGPWLLPAERALIASKCGYAESSDDDDNVTMTDGALICSNGRRVDDPEVRAMMRVAGDRISERVSRVMSSSQVQDAIAAVSSEAVREAMASLRDLDLSGLEALGDLDSRRERRGRSTR